MIITFKTATKLFAKPSELIPSTISLSNEAHLVCRHFLPCDFLLCSDIALLKCKIWHKKEEPKRNGFILSAHINMLLENINFTFLKDHTYIHSFYCANFLVLESLPYSSSPVCGPGINVVFYYQSICWHKYLHNCLVQQIAETSENIFNTVSLILERLKPNRIVRNWSNVKIKN